MKFPKDLLYPNMYIKPNIYLCETDKTRICKLETTETKGTFKFNSYSELTFNVGRMYNNLVTGETRVNPYYNKIEAIRLIELEDFGFLELQGPELISDGIQERKSCTAYSLEYTLSQKYLSNFYINTGGVESIEVINASDEKNIIPIVLYDPTNPKLSLLHLVLSSCPGWEIGYVDPSLRTLSRQFEVDRESVYDFLMNEVCEKFNCYIVFDTINNTINVYAESLTSKFIGDGVTKTFYISPPFEQIGTVSVDGYKTTKWEYNSITGALTLDDAPVSGAHIEAIDGALTKWETDVFVTFENLAQEININYDSDSIKTKLTVTYGDDGDIREVNLGLPYLTDISYYYTVDWMGQDLYDAYTKYLQKTNKSQAEYAENAQKILDLQEKISALKLRTSLVYGMDSSVTEKTVGTYYVIDGGSYPDYTYKEVSLPADYKANTVYYKIDGVNVTEDKVYELYSAVRKFFIDTNGQLAPEINKPEIKDMEVPEGDWGSLLDGLTTSFDFVKEDYATFRAAITAQTSANDATLAFRTFLDVIWKELGLTTLNDLFLEPYKEIQGVNISAGYSQPNSDFYWFYYPVTIMIDSLNGAIDNRKKEIEPLEKELTTRQQENAIIADGLLMENNFTEGQIIRLSAFLREDELHIDDIIETELDDIDSIMKIKQDAMESGRIELQKLCQPQLQFSMTMANIYALPAFEPMVQQFQLGNVIKVALRPDYIKQSRLLQVDINFEDFSDFSCEFGELTSLRSQSDIHADLLSKAITAGKSVATSSSYWTRGADRATATDLKIQQGLLDATTQIKAIDGTQDAVIDKYGILLRTKGNGPDGYDPHQTRLVNNRILMTKDGWQTSSAGLGQFTAGGVERYGLIAEAVLAGHVEGSTIVGCDINIGNGAFVVNGETGVVTMNAADNAIDGYAKTEDIADLNSRTPIVSADQPVNVTDGQLWLDTSKDPYVLMIYSVNSEGTLSWNRFSQQDGAVVHTSQPAKYSAGDVWILSAEQEIDGVKWPVGSILKADKDLKWQDANTPLTKMQKNIEQTFAFNPDGSNGGLQGLTIGQKDNQFYVNISSTEMGFYGAEFDENGKKISEDTKVVSVGKDSATIQNAIFEGTNGTEFNNNAMFDKQVQIRKMDDSQTPPVVKAGFVWQIEENDSFSLVNLFS